MPAFRHWIAARERIPGFNPSGPNALVHLIARYSPTGVSLSGLAAIGVRRPPALLDRLLSTLCDLGQLRADRHGDTTVYRAVTNW